MRSRAWCARGRSNRRTSSRVYAREWRAAFATALDALAATPVCQGGSRRRRFDYLYFMFALVRRRSIRTCFASRRGTASRSAAISTPNRGLTGRCGFARTMWSPSNR
jgi:hypothetical protein